MATREQIRDWYQSVASPALRARGIAADEHLKAALDGLDEDEAAPLPIGLLGPSGVGKSTLINALLSERLSILPSGGVGPYTANLLRIRHATDPYFEVRYRGSSYIRGLQSTISRADRPDLLRLARLLVTGNQFSATEPSVLLELLRACEGGATSLVGDPQVRRCLGDLKRAQQTGDGDDPRRRWSAGLDLPEFLRTLHQHVAGHLSPLVDSAVIGWDAPVLATGVELLDLPGVGVANDVYAHRTRSWAQTDTGLLLLVDRAGITDKAAEILQRWLQLNSPDLVQRRLLIAITRLDLSADELRRRRRQARTSGATSWTGCLREVRGEAIAMVREQLRQQFRDSALDSLAARVQVHAVAPTEYQRIHRRDPEDPSRLSDPADTGVPGLARAIRRAGLLHVPVIAAALDLLGAAEDHEAFDFDLPLNKQDLRGELDAPIAGARRQ